MDDTALNGAILSTEYDNALGSAMTALGVKLTDGAVVSLRKHMELVLEANKQFNLTRVATPASFAVDLHADSLAIVAWAKENDICDLRMLDVGSGAGIPAMPVAIVQSDWSVTALDSRQKKAHFIEQAAATLDLFNLESVHEHSEHLVIEQPFDLITFKAVARLEACLRMAYQIGDPGTRILVFKTSNMSGEELVEGDQFAKEARLTVEPPYHYTLPRFGETLNRVLYIYRIP